MFRKMTGNVGIVEIRAGLKAREEIRGVRRQGRRWKWAREGGGKSVFL
jgi:hypothetical protein